jgi:uncharacterized protein YeeX (DUF496 family)
MVHALEETCRVLKPDGILIDLRPISVDVPLLILTASGWKSAGIPDQSPDRVHDLAADHALRIVLQDGLFTRVKRKYFDVNNYWNSLKALKEDIEDRWKDDVIVSTEIWQEARILFKNGSGQKRVRFPFRKKISVYQKR